MEYRNGTDYKAFMNDFEMYLCKIISMLNEIIYNILMPQFSIVEK